MSDRVWILGAPDPEMTLIEDLLRTCGEEYIYALDADGERVHPGNAYRCQIPVVPEGSTVYAVECIDTLPEGWVRIDHHRLGDPGFGESPAEFMSASSIGQVIAELAIQRRWREETAEGGVYFPSEIPIELAGWRTLPGGSHHDHDSTWSIEEIGEYTDDGSGEASGEAFVKEMVEEDGYYHVPSIGWVLVASRGGHELGGCVDAIVIPDRFVLAAAADHCLAHAYRGECPGVDPDALMQWRAETRAAHQGRSVDDVLADIALARRALQEAAIVDCDFNVEGWCDGCGPNCMFCPRCGTFECGANLECPPDYYMCVGVLDLRDYEVPELPEAASREGVAYLATVVDRDGREKVVLGGLTTPEMVREFMEQWAPAEGLVDIYGDPARGFAGGYLGGGK